MHRFRPHHSKGRCDPVLSSFISFSIVPQIVGRWSTSNSHSCLPLRTKDSFALRCQYRWRLWTTKQAPCSRLTLQNPLFGIQYKHNSLATTLNPYSPRSIHARIAVALFRNPISYTNGMPGSSILFFSAPAANPKETRIAIL